MLLFNGLLLDTEKAYLLNKPSGESRLDWDASLQRLAKKLHSFAVKFIVAAFKEQGGKLGRLKMSSALKVSTIDNKLRDLKWSETTIQQRTAPEALKIFRKNVEAEEAKKRPASAEASVATKRARFATKSSHVQQSSCSAVTSSGNCSHATGHCKPTNTPCSQCHLLVCSECALVISAADMGNGNGYVCPAHLHSLPHTDELSAGMQDGAQE